MNKIDYLTWLLTILSFIGVILNIQKKRAGFAVWFFTNISWAVIDFKVGLPAQGTTFIIFMLAAVYGWFSWGKK
ncbi:MAG TPA: hypothetical protein DCL49_14460 [Candidatus Omnitrophica bacterium]|nr:hypothetical protein [Candidatus Omnitrophota bacterium]